MPGQRSWASRYDRRVVKQQERPRKRLRLINGRMMTCPRCKRSSDILKYVPLMMIEEFVEDTTPVYKCPDCRWVFAPAERILSEVVRVA